MFWTTEANDHGLRYDPFKALVAPRPIGWISARSRSGATNLAPYSFFNGVSERPKIVMFASVGMKDTASFAIESGEFVVNLATRDLARAVNQTSAPAERGQSEFEIAGLTEAPCKLVSAPRVAESPAAFECRVTETLQPATLEGGRSDSVLIFGQVVAIHLDERVVVEGRVDMARLAPLSRLGYLDYAVADEVFEMPRPRLADGSDV